MTNEIAPVSDDTPLWGAVYVYDEQEFAEDVAEGLVAHPYDRAMGVLSQPLIRVPHEGAVGENAERQMLSLGQSDRELLARAALSLAEHLDSWHGGPDEMYAEADRLWQLARSLWPDSVGPDTEI